MLHKRILCDVCFYSLSRWLALRLRGRYSSAVLFHLGKGLREEYQNAVIHYVYAPQLLPIPFGIVSPIPGARALPCLF